MSRALSRQNVNNDVKRWAKAIADAESLLQRAEARAARLRGAIKTFAELRDLGHNFNGPNSVEEVELATRN